MTAELTVLEKAALLSGKNVWETRAITRAGVRSLFLADGPHGVRKQLGSADHLGLHESQAATCFPTAATVANSWDPELARQIGAALGVEAANLGVDVLLGPGLNIKRSPLCGRNFEYFSEDPFLAGRLASGYVLGIQSEGVAACPKHFAANSQELRRMTSDSIVDERTLREIYLSAFEAVVRDAKPMTIMSSYNRINGTYANENAFLLQTILRDEWGFDGTVVTDWGGGNDPVAAVAAGGTLEMPAPGLDSANQIVQAVNSGRLSIADLDKRVDEMLALVNAIGPRQERAVDVEAHHALARRAAEQSVVLLKNSDSLLPLANGTRVLVVGDFAQTPRYQGAGSSVVNPTRLLSGLDAVKASDLDYVGFAQGFTRGGVADPALVAEAVAAAATADVVLLYLGLDEISESEGQDRSHLRMPPNQLELLARLKAVNEKIVVVLSAGSVVELPWLDDCQALLHGYLGGQAGAEGMVRVITGAVNPSGRLAETYPVRLADTPNHLSYPSDGATAEYREGLYVGYRYYTTAKVPVTFPFGFGLSYTTFEYGDLEVTAAGVTFSVTNTGAVAGAEVAQLYVGRNSASGLFRPSLELKGFAKVELAPGETGRVTVPFDDTTFRYFSVVDGGWEIESGRYDVHVGANVADLRLTAVHDVVGTVDAVPAPAYDLDHYVSGQVTSVPDAEFAALLGRAVPPSVRVAGPLSLNDPLSAMREARSPLARGANWVLRKLMARAEAKGKPDLNLLFLYGMPFRALAKMTGGTLSIAMTEQILRIVNGHFFRGFGGLVRAFLRNRSMSRRLQRELDATSTSSVDSH